MCTRRTRPEVRPSWANFTTADSYGAITPLVSALLGRATPDRVRVVDLLTELVLPLVLAVLGIGGTIVVTAIQLRARRAELEDERRARDAADREQRREKVISAVYDTLGPLIAASTIPQKDRLRMPNNAAAAVARATRMIRLSREPDSFDLHEWWGIRTKQFAQITRLDDLEPLEVATLAEISAWYDSELTARQILEIARRGV